MAALSSRRIRAVRSARLRAASSTMVVHALGRDDSVPTHVAVVAGRAIGGAVERNRAKRRLRAAVRQARLPSDVDLVIDARPATVRAPFTTLHRDVERLSRRAAERTR
ncbi:MAG: ribonuclease P protein component [Actinobacteria bacterium]|nr:ribonuclease P protein component [Actinomycetota bacterium]